ncbi:MAG: glycoside hydrolase family 2 protein [bacterium]
MKKTIHLDGSWEFRLDKENSDQCLIPEDAFPERQWLKGCVPGTIHTDLIANQLLEDPFYRDNELRTQWVDKATWLYRKEFQVTEEHLSTHAIHLVAEGLDTIADIFLNGRKVAHTENMHITHRFEVKRYLKAGRNELCISFSSPTLHGKRLEAEHGVLCETHQSHRLYMRKAQYSFGWDWGPVLPTCGIWKSIYLEAFNTVRIKDALVRPTLDKGLQTATLDVEIELERFTQDGMTFQAVIEVDDIGKEVAIKTERESVQFTIERPKLWWPAGYGDQHLYRLHLKLFADGESQDSRELHFGIRKLELVQGKDPVGESFLFRINDVPIYCKGANWIPADNFLPRVPPEHYQTLLQMAKDANMNMIRVWGGGVYEHDIFYALCDQMGLLVWQDFMFACGACPEYEGYRHNVAKEVESVVKRLRNHPCIVLWCGNNESEWMWYGSTRVSYEDMPGLSLFQELIPGICSRLDPTRPYWPSSPFGGTDPNSQEKGNQHQWDIWSHWQDFTTVENDNSRFISEFGFQAPANLPTLERVTLPDDRHPQHEIIEFHNKQVEGQERLFRFLAGHVQMPSSFQDFIYKCQLVQGEALKRCIEHWRRNKFQTAGSLVWQLNDCWPVASWSLIDSELTPKAAYFCVKRAFQPIMVALFRQMENISVWVINDTLRRLSAVLILKTLSFLGECKFEEKVTAEVQPNCSCNIHRVELRDLNLDEASTYLIAELWVDGERASENRLFFKRFKHLRLPVPVFEKRLCSLKDGTYLLTLRSSSFAKSVHIALNKQGTIEDNSFDLEANCEKKIRISLHEEKALTEPDVSIHSLGSQNDNRDR